MRHNIKLNENYWLYAKSTLILITLGNELSIFNPNTWPKWESLILESLVNCNINADWSENVAF